MTHFYLMTKKKRNFFLLLNSKNKSAFYCFLSVQRAVHFNQSTIFFLRNKILTLHFLKYEKTYSERHDYLLSCFAWLFDRQSLYMHLLRIYRHQSWFYAFHWTIQCCIFIIQKKRKNTFIILYMLMSFIKIPIEMSQRRILSIVYINCSNKKQSITDKYFYRHTSIKKFNLFMKKK
jgi:hypothetical protein